MSILDCSIQLQVSPKLHCTLFLTLANLFGSLQGVYLPYRQEVDRQIAVMLLHGIIQESSSPWIGPTVFVLCLCVDYCELNKKTTKGSYPLPLTDEVQDRLPGQTFSLYWTYRVATGKCLSIRMTKKILPFVLDLAWDYLSLKQCLLACQVHPALSSISWTRSYKKSHL